MHWISDPNGVLPSEDFSSDYRMMPVVLFSALESSSQFYDFSFRYSSLVILTSYTGFSFGCFLFVMLSGVRSTMLKWLPDMIGGTNVHLLAAYD